MTKESPNVSLVRVSAADSPIDLVYGLRVRRRDGETSRRCLLDHASAALDHPHLWVAVVLQSVLVPSGQLHLGEDTKPCERFVFLALGQFFTSRSQNLEQPEKNVSFLRVLLVQPSPPQRPSHRGCPG